MDLTSLFLSKYILLSYDFEKGWCNSSTSITISPDISYLSKVLSPQPTMDPPPPPPTPPSTTPLLAPSPPEGGLWESW
ncbi:hypothetical protein J1N35_031743 [Gossypium stocksii]|uniref:Uncharacterized protein n=1 Tax=Gossypium stocksii TaxID=47602 RepID=A0A9D3ZU24_9ROSI|nr:hypothetical protein J1N35_031743 [Gossypium stocksii]